MSWRLPNKFTNRQVRDLAWVLLSPKLESIGNFPFNECESSKLELLNRLDEDPTPLDRYLQLNASNDHRLGRYYENLFGFYLSHHNDSQNLIRNLTITSSERTLGELDILAQLKGEDNYQHIEVAVKFYLGKSDLMDSANWIGLNARDTLAAKVSKTTAKQLKLPYQEQAIQILKKQNIRVKSSSAVFNGCLFYPWTDYADHRFTFPSDVNVNHLKGWWLCKDSISLLDQQSIQYQRLEKRQWLSELYEDEMQPESLETISSAIEDRAVMLARLIEKDGIWQELDRGVVTPRSWPKR